MNNKVVVDIKTSHPVYGPLFIDRIYKTEEWCENAKSITWQGMDLPILDKLPILSIPGFQRYMVVIVPLDLESEIIGAKQLST